MFWFLFLVFFLFLDLGSLGFLVLGLVVYRAWTDEEPYNNRQIAYRTSTLLFWLLFSVLVLLSNKSRESVWFKVLVGLLFVCWLIYRTWTEEETLYEDSSSYSAAVIQGGSWREGRKELRTFKCMEYLAVGCGFFLFFIVIYLLVVSPIDPVVVYVKHLRNLTEATSNLTEATVL